MLNVNFLNAISGWSEKNKRPYLVTTGAIAGKRLGMQLMKIFSDFLKQHKSDLRIHFVGYKPDSPIDFSPAMKLWNHDGAGDFPAAGIHCLTFESHIDDHKYLEDDDKKIEK